MNKEQIVQGQELLNDIQIISKKIKTLKDLIDLSGNRKFYIGTLLYDEHFAISNAEAHPFLLKILDKELDKLKALEAKLENL